MAARQNPSRMATPQTSAPAGIPARAFTPIQNPVYLSTTKDGSWKVHPQPGHVLEGQPDGPAHVDRRLTSAGDRPPVAGLTPIIPAAYQTPENVWALFPA